LRPSLRIIAGIFIFLMITLKKSKLLSTKMKRKLLPTKIVLAIAGFVFISGMLHAQLPGWTYRMPINVTETTGSPQANYQVKLVVNTAALIAAGRMDAGGNDIRFADSCATTIFSHHVESGINTTATTIWVMLPSLPANASTSLFMYYGNASAPNTSSFAATFPAALITTTNITLSATQVYDWLEVSAGDTIFVSAGQPLILHARNVVVNGAIIGTGRGENAPAINTAGIGPGAGGTSANSGSGGGSYGGQGGLGGLDAGDTPGNGGPVYGTIGGTDINMGSSGGSGTTIAGSGGGCLTINADYITVNGSIIMDGNAAASTASRGGGGGAGGGIMLNGFDVTMAGTLSANGGLGGQGTSTFNDGGGGGGGGRIKIFTTGTLTNSGTTTVNGGTGGGFGDQAPGQPGATGTTNAATGAYMIPTIVTGNEMTIGVPPSVTYSDGDNIICIGDTVTATAQAGFSSYVFLVNGSPVSTQASNVYAYSGLNSGDVLAVAGIYACASDTSALTTVTVLASPVAGTLTADSVICEGGTINLQTSGSTGLISWYEINGPTYTFIGTGDPLTSPVMNTAGTFTFTAVASNNSCPDDTAAVMVSTIVNAAPVAGAASSIPSGNLCADDSILFMTSGSTGFVDWYVQIGAMGPWSQFGSGDPFDPGPPSNADTGSYAFQAIVSTPGCPADSSNIVLLDVHPTPEVHFFSDTTQCGGTVLLDAGNPGDSYLWSTSAVTQTLSVNASGTYYVDVTNSHGCSSSDTIVVTIHPNPTLTISASNSSPCLDDAAITLTGLPAGGMWTGTAVTGTSFSPTTAGTGTHPVTYSYTDGNGCSASQPMNIIVNACVGMTEHDFGNAVTVFPNPNNGAFTLSINANIGDMRIEVSDAEGRVVYSSIENDVNAGFTKQVNLEELAVGLYVMKLTSSTSQKVQLISIQK
jgi:hypothetical protein